MGCFAAVVDIREHALVFAFMQWHVYTCIGIPRATRLLFLRPLPLHSVRFIPRHFPIPHVLPLVLTLVVALLVHHPIRLPHLLPRPYSDSVFYSVCSYTLVVAMAVPLAPPRLLTRSVSDSVCSSV